MRWINPAVERITGYRPDECLRMADYPLPLVQKADRPMMAQLWAEALAGSSGNDVHFRVQHKDGSPRWAAISWQSIYDVDDSPMGFRASVRDISERRAMEEQIRAYAEDLEKLVEQRTARIQQLEARRLQVEKLAALAELAAGIAHEINNPLAGIRNAFQLLKEGFPKEHRYFEYMELIDAEIERVSSIVHQLHQLYRPFPNPAVSFDLERAIRHALMLLRTVAAKQHVALEMRIAAGTIVKLPEGELKQVVYNLLLNAIQASPAGSSVCLQARVANGKLDLTVEDHGSGIPDDVLPHIFEAFFSTKHGNSGQGLGLGLPVSKSIVEALGGTIRLVTRSGQGTRIDVHIPLSDDEKH